MSLTEEHKLLIKQYRFKKKYGRKKLLKEFPEKNWKTSQRKNMNFSIKYKYWHCWKPDFDLGEWPLTNLSLREIEVETGILRESVQCIANFDLCLTAFKQTNKCTTVTREGQRKRTERRKMQLHYIKLANSEKTFFAGEKIFKLKAWSNKQNDRIYGISLSDIR